MKHRNMRATINQLVHDRVISQRLLADVAVVSESKISRWLSGETVKKIGAGCIHEWIRSDALPLEARNRIVWALLGPDVSIRRKIDERKLDVNGDGRIDSADVRAMVGPMTADVGVLVGSILDAIEDGGVTPDEELICRKLNQCVDGQLVRISAALVKMAEKSTRRKQARPVRLVGGEA